MVKRSKQVSVLFNAPKPLIADFDKLAVKRRTTRSKLLREAIRQFLRDPAAQAEIAPNPLRRTPRVVEVEKWFLNLMRENGGEMLGGEMWRAAIQAGIGWGSLCPVRSALRRQGRLHRPIDCVRNPWKLLW
jgi:Ribbon-helix-helix protein, copG family